VASPLTPALARSRPRPLPTQHRQRPPNNIKLTQARASTAASGASSLVWKWLQAWLLAAAARAPSTTEAMLHQFMGSSATPPLRQASSTAQAPATSAALRRASELLSLCARARRKGGPGAAQDATLALCRKQFYAGLAKGAAVAQRDELASDIAAHVAHSLDAAIKNKLSPKLVEERYLTAAALLATSPMCGPETAACYALLRGLTGGGGGPRESVCLWVPWQRLL
jgi:hypothetical protein